MPGHGRSLSRTHRLTNNVSGGAIGPAGVSNTRTLSANASRWPGVLAAVERDQANTISRRGSASLSAERVCRSLNSRAHVSRRAGSWL